MTKDTFFDNKLSRELYEPPTWIDNSNASVCNRCPRKYFLQCRLGIVPVQEHMALSFGTGIHAGVVHAKTRDSGKAMEAFRKSFTQDVVRDTRRTDECAERIFESYGRHYASSPQKIKASPDFRLQTIDEISEDEISFAIDIDGELPFIGRIDCWGENLETGQYFVKDFKTASVISKFLLQGQGMNPQGLGYAYACRLSGLPIEEIIYEFLQVNKTKAEIYPVTVTVSDAKLEAWLHYMQETVACIGVYQDLEFWPPRLTGCNGYTCYGMPTFQCDYEAICSTGDLWPNLVDGGMYHIKRWKPFEVKEEEEQQEVADGDGVAK